MCRAGVGPKIHLLQVTDTIPRGHFVCNSSIHIVLSSITMVVDRYTRKDNLLRILWVDGGGEEERLLQRELRDTVLDDGLEKMTSQGLETQHRHEDQKTNKL